MNILKLIGQGLPGNINHFAGLLLFNMGIFCTPFINNILINFSRMKIAVPIYYKQRRDLTIGDKVVIKDRDLALSFTIKNFVRDVQMNSSMLTSKRFVVSCWALLR